MSNKNEIQRVGLRDSAVKTVEALYNRDNDVGIKFARLFCLNAGILSSSAVITLSLVDFNNYFFNIFFLSLISVMMVCFYVGFSLLKVKLQHLKETGVVLGGLELTKEAYRRHNLKKDKTEE